ncbi:hypothetical protein [Methylobacterium radiotolerans]|uniref:hypothetical protein n=1 Tax=Methylobacterium radiotolerans TaxID=31998 RepID=UPI0015F47042|nr:hypothetical protein [Methylobacterium radiotolerans]
MKLSALHVLRRAMGLVGLVAAGERDKLAMKVIVPAGCSASPNAVVAALPGKARPSVSSLRRPAAAIAEAVVDAMPP